MKIAAVLEQRSEYWLELISRRRMILTRVFLVITGLVVIGSFVWPPVFKSTSEVLVQANRAQLLVSPGLQDSHDSNQPTVFTSPVTEEDLNSETELLTSRYLMQRTLERTKGRPEKSGLVEDAAALFGSILALPQNGYSAVHALRIPTEEQEQELKLEQKLKVVLIKRSNVIEISFRSREAAWGQTFLRQFLDEYLELHAFLSHDPKAERFFLNQASVLNERLQRSEEKLRAVQLQTGITDFDGQRSALILQRYNLEAEQRKTSADLAAAREQMDSLQRQMVSTPQREVKESKSVQNLALQTLKPQVLQLETERAELLSRYLPTSKRIREIDVQLDAARKILSHENASEVHETTTDVNPTWAALDTNLALARSQAASLQASAQAQLEQIDDCRKQLNALASDGLIVERMQSQVEADKEAYLSYLRKGEEARAAEALNQNKILNVSVIQPPSYPIRPDFPNIPLNLAAGMLLGLVAGLAAAHWEEEYDQKLYSVATVSELSRLPIVAVVKERG